MPNINIYVFLTLVQTISFGQDIPDPKDVAVRAAFKAMISMTDPAHVNFGAWTYEGGVIVRGLWEIQNVYADILIEPFLHTHLNYFETEPSEFGYKILNSISLEPNITLDNYSIGFAVFPIAYADRLKYAKDFDAFIPENDAYIVRKVVETYVYGFPYHLDDGTISNPFWAGDLFDPRGKYVWVDDMFRGTALTNELSRISGEPEHVLESANQLIRFSRYLTAEDGLLHHGFNNFTGEQSCCKWGRGNGWSLMGKADTLATLEDLGLQENGIFYTELLTLFVSHCEGIKAFQSEIGGWHNIITNDETFIKTSSTAMYLLSFITGVERGWLDQEAYRVSIENAWQVLAANVLIDGTVVDIIRGTGMMNTEGEYDRGRDYVNAGSGLSGVLRAIAAFARYHERYYENM